MVLVPMFAIATGGTHAQAGTARRLAFGGDTACLPGADESREWYARLADAADQAYFEFGDVLAGTGAVVPERGLLGHGGGVRLRLSADPRWGTAAFEFQDDGERGRTDGAFAAGWARSFGGLDLGLAGRFSTYGDAHGGSATGFRSDAQYFHLYGLGLRTSPRDGLVLEGAGEIVNTMAESADALHRLDQVSTWRSFGLRARAAIRLTPRLELVPHVDHFRDRRSEYSVELGGPGDVDDRLTRVGLAAVVRPRALVLLVIGGEYRTGRDRRQARPGDTVDYDWTMSFRDFYQVRGRVGLEAETLSWLTLRAGIAYVRADDEWQQAHTGAVQDTEVPPGEVRAATSVATPLSAGFGIHHGAWTVDLTWVDRAPLSDGLAAFGPSATDDAEYSALSLAVAF